MGLRKVKPTTIYLQLEDRSITFLRGLIKDVLFKVDKFIFPVDFIVLNMQEEKKNYLILERPFLFRGRNLIDVY